MTPATIKVAGAPVLTDDQRRAVQELRDYAHLYGPDFTTAAFNPSVARWRDRPEDRERYLRGNTLRGRPWLSLNALKAAAPDGKWNTLRVMAGFEANRPGPTKGRKRPAGQHAPIRDGVSDRARLAESRREAAARSRARARAEAPASQREDASAAAQRAKLAEREAAASHREATRLAEQLAKVNERLTATRERARKADLAMRKQRDRADRNAEVVAALRAELRDVGRTLAETLNGRENAETAAAEQLRETARVGADVLALREEVAETREELDRAQELRELADPEEMERARAEVRGARERVAVAREAQVAAERSAALARAAQREAQARADRAEREAGRARSEVREVREAVAGHDRQLTPEELAELRAAGPAGSAVFLAAVKDVARANAKGQRQPLREALRRAAGAAVRWADRL